MPPGSRFKGYEDFEVQERETSEVADCPAHTLAGLRAKARVYGDGTVNGCPILESLLDDLRTDHDRLVKPGKRSTGGVEDSSGPEYP